MDDRKLLSLLENVRVRVSDPNNPNIELEPAETAKQISDLPFERKCVLLSVYFAQFKHGRPPLTSANQVEVINALLSAKMDGNPSNRSMLLSILLKGFGLNPRLIESENERGVEIRNPKSGEWEEFDMHGQCVRYIEYVQRINEATSESKKQARALFVSAQDEKHNLLSVLPQEVLEKIVQTARDKSVLTEKDAENIVTNSLRNPPH